MEIITQIQSRKSGASTGPARIVFWWVTLKCLFDIRIRMAKIRNSSKCLGLSRKRCYRQHFQRDAVRNTISMHHGVRQADGRCCNDWIHVIDSDHISLSPLEPDVQALKPGEPGSRAPIITGIVGEYGYSSSNDCERCIVLELRCPCHRQGAAFCACHRQGGGERSLLYYIALSQPR